MIAIVYCYTCLVNGKKYIGQTWHEARRNRAHLRADGGARLFKSAVKKYGRENFTYEILQEGIADQTHLDLAEWLWIKQLDTLAPNGYNLREGGDGGKWSQEAKENLKQFHANKDEAAKKIKAEKCRIAAIKQWSDPKQHEAASAKRKKRITVKQAKQIISSINHQIKIAHKNAFIESEIKRKKTDPISREMIRRRTGRPVICIETGELFHSSYAAASAKNCVRINIHQVCSGYKKTAGGYHWKFADQ